MQTHTTTLVTVTATLAMTRLSGPGTLATMTQALPPTAKA